MPVNEQLADEQWRRYTYCRDRSHLEFITKADKCDKFFAGKQWDEQDIKALRGKQLPALTINKILPTVSNIAGEQIENRTETLFRPIAGAPSETADALSKVWMQISQNNQLPWVRSEVFLDGLIRSRGFFDVRMDFSDNVFGEVRITQENSKNVVIDPDAHEYDPDSWGDVHVSKWMSTQDIAMLYSEEDAELLKSRVDNLRYGYDSVDYHRDSFSDRSYDHPGEGEGVFDTAQMRSVRVIDRQYRKLTKAEHFIDIVTGETRLVPNEWNRNRIALFLEKAGGNLSVIKRMVKRIRWTVTAGDIVLHDEWSPYRHFTVVPYFPHFRYGATVGMVENLLSPQEILNKASSQELHVINTTANSGWIVEEGSLLNMTIEELAANGSKTGIVLEYKKNAQPPTKIQPNQIPSGLDRITYKAEEHIKGISGVSDSMQGFDREDVAAKAIAYKQQRGSVNLTKVVDNLGRTDWLLARNVLDLIQTFYTNERVISITHDDVTHQSEQMTVNAVDPVTQQITYDLSMGEYSIVITSTPSRATLEDSQFEQARALKELGVPIPDSVLIENSRLQHRAEIAKQLEAQNSSPEAQQQAELNMRGLAADVAEKEAKVGKTQAEAQQKGADAQIKANEAAGGNDGELQKMHMEMQMERERLDMELEKMRQEMQLKMQEMQMKMQMQQEQHAQDQRIKEQNAQQDMMLKEEQAAQQAEAQRVQALRQESATSQPANRSTT